MPVRRVTPPSTSRQQFPAAPGPRALGEVRELKVVPGSLGREREFIDVSRDKRAAVGPPAGRFPRRPRRTSRARSCCRRRSRARAYIPIRGKKKKPTKKGAKTQITEKAEHKKVIRIEESISVSELSQAMGVKASDLIRKLMQAGTMATINQQIDADTATFLATEFGYTVEKKGFEVEEYIPEVEVDESKLVIRPPVVTVMGHVDHGKTSLLDAIRQADVAAGEAGGITQHIGAYSVQTAAGPDHVPRHAGPRGVHGDAPARRAGHRPRRARGRRGRRRDAADGGVDQGGEGRGRDDPRRDQQGRQAGRDARARHAAAHRVRARARAVGRLDDHAPVSARTKQGIPELLEYIALQSEVLELKSNPEKLASGRVIEAKLEKGRGPVATVLVEEGTLRVGDALVTGTHYGRVRAMMNERGEQVDDVPPGYPVEVLGLSGVPVAGDEFDVVEDEKAAKEVASHRAEKQRQKELGSVKKASLEDLFAKAKSGGGKVLNLVVKADVQGSAEAVTQALQKAATKKVGVKILDSAVGAITKSDVLTAAAGTGVIVGFNTKPASEIESIANH